MIFTIFPWANWSVGTAIIIVFALVCIAIAALVIRFWMTGKKKEED